MNTECEAMLCEHGIKPTPNRLLVLDALISAGRPLSMKELEDDLETLDKSSIFRCLTLMKEQGLLHMLESGSDGARYEVCHDHDHASGEDADEHVHFLCEMCGRTFCLEDVPIPSVSVPEGYSALHREYTLKGICASCAAKG